MNEYVVPVVLMHSRGSNKDYGSFGYTADEKYKRDEVLY